MCIRDRDRILNGTKKAEFAIIVISENFFDREWTCLLYTSNLLNEQEPGRTETPREGLSKEKIEEDIVLSLIHI